MNKFELRRLVRIKEMQAIAKKRGGICLSKEYVNASSKLKWRCKNAHEWTAVPYSIASGSWCPDCAGIKKLTLKDCQAVARSHGGRCLSRTYVNGKTPMKWECKYGHTFSAVLNNVRNGGNWCVKCVRPGSGQTIKDLKILAKSRGGKCLSKSYITARTKYKWQCKLMHNPWLASSDEIKRGRWCKECSNGLGERITRAFFEAIFKKPFPSVRPDFLKNINTGFNYELDGYCESLKLAFEHQGRQHYKSNSLFSEGEKLSKRVSDDEVKRKLCKKSGITLIEIPSVPDMLSLNDFKTYLGRELHSKGHKIPAGFDFDSVDLSNAYSPDMQKKLNKLREYAVKKSGVLISKEYLGYHVKHEFQCEFKHVIWKATPAKIYSGRWCPECSGRKKKTIEEVRRFIESRGFKLLSEEYINHKSKLWVKCNKGHDWEVTFDSLNHSKSGCPHCFNEKRKSGFYK